MLIFLFLVCCILCNSIINAAYCSGSPQPGNRTNENGYSMMNLKLIKTVPNGKLYHAGPQNARFPVVQVWGSAYEMGYAQVFLAAHEIIIRFSYR
jgi:hypothetical protein